MERNHACITSRSVLQLHLPGSHATRTWVRNEVVGATRNEDFLPITPPDPCRRAQVQIAADRRSSSQRKLVKPVPALVAGRSNSTPMVRPSSRSKTQRYPIARRLCTLAAACTPVFPWAAAVASAAVTSWISTFFKLTSSTTNRRIRRMTPHPSPPSHRWKGRCSRRASRSAS